MKFILKTLLAATLILASVETFAQSSYRSSFNERRKSVMDANDMRASYHNFGQGGTVNQSIPNEFSYEYPKNSRREYMLFQMIFIGAEVENQLTDAAIPTFPILNMGNLKTEPRTNASWSLNPVTGYANSQSQELARSDRGPGSPLGNTWPSVWPDKLEDGGDGWAGSWNGFFGRDQFNSDLEFFYRMSDDRYTRYVQGTSTKFQPDLTDPTRGGLGLLMDVRILAWTQTLIANAHFNIFEVKNDASFDYDKMAFGVWIADLVAVNSQNDVPEFDVLRSIAYITDNDRNEFPPFFEGPIGEMGLKFLETPGNAIDGIDNDGDSFQYDQRFGNFYKPINTDLMMPHLEANGGFFTSIAQLDSMIPQFGNDAIRDDFAPRSYGPGDKMILIDQDFNRIVIEYEAGKTIRTRGGRQITLPEGGLSGLVEDFLDEADENFGVHVDLFDNDYDGLIDESRPNHFSKATFDNSGNSIIVPVRHINYFQFAIGDTIKPGFIVSNRQIRERIASDPDFAAYIRDVRLGNWKSVYTAAPMIDEGRDDGFDNDNDWVASSDDIGIAGDPDSPSQGAGDGLPTSGAGTSFPGEPNIDKTDVSETDLIGVSRVTIIQAGLLQFLQDNENWNSYLVPGDFEVSGTPGVDSDIFVSSSLFPLLKGQTERFAIAVTAVQTKSANRLDDRVANNRSLTQAENAYEADYQFAVAPPPPKVTAVAGDGVVTLYWDTTSEAAFDRYVARITGNGNDFEGYRVYRSSDVGLNDIAGITDAFGTAQFRTPLVIYDRVNEFSGLHPVPVNGTQYNMGSNSGIRRMYVDSTVHNGKEYFYAVTAFDFGIAEAGIAPSESAIQSTREPDGTVTLGQNVVRVRPAASQAGYIDPENPMATQVSGSAAGTVRVDVIDTEALRPSTYRIVFEDTLIAGGNSAPDTLRTKNFTLLNVSASPPDTLIDKSTATDGQDNPVVEGFKLTLTNASGFGLNRNATQWITTNNNPPIHPYQIFPSVRNAKPSDYKIVFGPVGYGMSSDKPVNTLNGVRTYPAKQTNFRVYNVSEDPGMQNPIEYAFFEAAFDPDQGQFSAFRTQNGVYTDVVRFIEDFRDQQDVDTWLVQMNASFGGGVQTTRNPAEGDTLSLITIKPFSRLDVFEFQIQDVINTGTVDNEKAKDDLKKIKVVPNPYIVTSPFETSITNSSNQQQRELHFNHLPIPSTLRIFTVSGVLIRELKFDATDSRVYNGTYVWNMLTKDNLEISYGIYLYHVEAPGVGETTGKFAVIK